VPFQPNQTIVQCAFIGTWIALGIGGTIFYWRASPAMKRKAWLVMTPIVGLLFLAFIYLLQGTRGASFAAIPVAIIAYLNLHSVKFCPKCGASNRSPSIFPVPKYCGKCGAQLDSPVVSGN